jgi:hypothetical protein
MYNDHLGIAGMMCRSVKSTTRLHIEQAEYSCILSVHRKLATLLKVFIVKNTTGLSYPDTPPTHISVHLIVTVTTMPDAISSLGSR